MASASYTSVGLPGQASGTSPRPPGCLRGRSLTTFKSKEAFGFEIINLYFANGREVIRETLLNDSLPPIQRLVAYIDTYFPHISG